jgi:hypothetical protein
MTLENIAKRTKAISSVMEKNKVEKFIVFWVEAFKCNERGIFFTSLPCKRLVDQA